jgi:hypothetical protein
LLDIFEPFDILFSSFKFILVKLKSFLLKSKLPLYKRLPLIDINIMFFEKEYERIIFLIFSKFMIFEIGMKLFKFFSINLFGSIYFIFTII